jgi:hypothetical protein
LFQSRLANLANQFKFRIETKPDHFERILKMKTKTLNPKTLLLSLVLLLSSSFAAVARADSSCQNMSGIYMCDDGSDEIIEVRGKYLSFGGLNGVDGQIVKVINIAGIPIAYQLSCKNKTLIYRGWATKGARREVSDFYSTRRNPNELVISGSVGNKRCTLGR